MQVQHEVKQAPACGLPCSSDTDIVKPNAQIDIKVGDMFLGSERHRSAGLHPLCNSFLLKRMKRSGPSFASQDSIDSVRLRAVLSTIGCSAGSLLE